MAEEQSSSEKREMEGLLRNKFITLNKHDVNNDSQLHCKSNRKENPSDETGDCKIFVEKETFDLAISSDENKMKIWRKSKFSFDKSLFAFRVTQFLWFGAGGLPSVFLGIFLKQRGLTIVELSSAYSMIFLFQLIVGSIAGVITDKIGNAKPVMIFLMLSTFSVSVSMLLTPNINSVSCTEVQKNFTISNVTDNIGNFSSCYHCLQKQKVHLEFNKSDISNFDDTSFNENLDELLTNIPQNSGNVSSISKSNIAVKLFKTDCCVISTNNKNVYCVNNRKEYLVPVYCILVVAFYSVYSTTYRFLNFVAVSFAIENDSHFGKEYSIAKSGNLFVVIIVGFVLNMDKSSGSKANYDPVIWTAAGVIFCAFLTFCNNTVPVLPPGTHLTKKALTLLKDTDILAFILVVYVAGNGYSFNYAFDMVFLETLNVSSTVVALHAAVIIFYGLPVLLTFKWWLKVFDANRLFVLGLLFYAVHNVALSYILNPWWCLLIDVTKAFTSELFWAAAVVHCRNVAPVGFAATLNALMGTVHYGIGRSSGVFFGGMMMNYLGPRKAFRILAVMFFTVAVLYSVFLYIRHKYPKPKAKVKGSGTEDGKCTENTDFEDA